MKTGDAVLALHELARAYEHSSRAAIARGAKSPHGQDDIHDGVDDAAAAVVLRGLADSLAARAKARRARAAL